MSKALRKAVVMRSRMKNLYLKNKTDLNWSNYKTQRNFCTNLLRKTKKEYFSKLDIIKISDSKKFWKTIKPFFSDKGLNCNKMMLSENDQIISDETTIADTMNKYFVNITKKLKLKQSETEINELSLSEILDKYKDHQSIVKIRPQMNGKKNLFSFKPVTSEEVLKTIYTLKNNKGSLSYTIPVKILKTFSGSFLPYLTGVINHSITTSSFPDELKLAEVISAFKKDDPLDKENYRPISLLSHTSKIYEKILFNQINDYIEPYFSHLLTGFRRNYSTQHCLIKMQEKWKHLLDNGYNIGVLFMDLSKAFDVLNHSLLLAKLDAYGFSLKSTTFIQSYLNKRMQKVNVNNKFSAWEDIL